jgi:hypothetical protein
VDFIRSIDAQFEQYDDSGKLLVARSPKSEYKLMVKRHGLRLLMISSIMSGLRSRCEKVGRNGGRGRSRDRGRARVRRGRNMRCVSRPERPR